MDQTEAYNQHFKRLYRYFYYRDVDQLDIEDLCQEAFIVFFRKYDCAALQPDEIAKLLYTISQFTYKKYCSKRATTETRELEEDIPVYDVPFELYEEGVIEDQLEQHRDSLLAAIEELNPTLQAVVKLRFIEGMTRSEVAERLGTKEKYVHIYQQRAIKALQKKLTEPVSPPGYTY